MFVPTATTVRVLFIRAIFSSLALAFGRRTNGLCVLLGHNWNGHCITRWYVSSRLD